MASSLPEPKRKISQKGGGADSDQAAYEHHVAKVFSSRGLGFRV